MKKTTVQTGLMQTILFNGKFSHYRCTLPIPAEVAQSLNYEYCHSKGNRWFYVRESDDWDKLWFYVNLMQVTVNDYKVVVFEQKKLRALERCAEYKNTFNKQ